MEQVVRFLTRQQDVVGSSGGTLEYEQESELAARDARGKTWWSRERQNQPSPVNKVMARFSVRAQWRLEGAQKLWGSAP